MNFNELTEDIKKCRICEETFGFEPNPVTFGKSTALIAQIGQAPSLTVNNTGKFFTDKSGDKLKYEWYEITDEEFYNEDNFYMTGMSHCYPGKSPNGGDKKPPKICYEKWVKKEIELIDNEIFIIIGSYAAHTLFPNEDFEELIFKDNILNGKPAFVLPHPSPLNFRWFEHHPSFEQDRLPTIRKKIKEILKK